MQSNQKWKVFGIVLIFLCLICLVVGAIGYFYVSNQPPSTLTNGSGYYVRWTKVYYLGGFPSTAFEIVGADVSSFEIIDTEYAKDKSQVYFNGIAISNADPTTFEVLDLWFSRDKNHVYISGEIFSSDPANFEIFFDSLYRDSQHIYWGQEIISDDPENLEIIGNQDYYTYIKDSKNVFVNGNLIEDADVDTFEMISAGYGRDANRVYYFDTALSADPNTFEVLEIPYSRDSQKVFWMENEIPNADPDTFMVLLANFECSADAQTAYYQDQPIPDFDPSTIPADKQVIGCNNTEVILYP